MSLLDDLADALAREALAVAEQTGDERLIDEMSKAIGESSPTTQEAFMTAVRIRRALDRGRVLMDRRRGTRALPAPDAHHGDAGARDAGKGDAGQGDTGDGDTR